MKILSYFFLVCILLSGCVTEEVQPDQQPPPGEPLGQVPPSEEPGIGEEPVEQPTDGPEGGPQLPEYISGDLIQPSDFQYLGAFRLPSPSGGSSWSYGGYAATFYPNGDSNGPDDGYPGSIFAIGHDHDQQISEISIPVPVISANKDVEELNTATTLQPFADVTGGMYGYLEIPRAGLEYLPPQGSQTSEKLYFAWSQHFDFEQPPSHGYCDLDLANPKTAGAWHVGGYTTYTTSDYMFEIPASWANANTPGMLLATGRFRDGVWSGLGPALFAIGPWNEGNPPSSGSKLTHVTPLLLYGTQLPGAVDIARDESRVMKYYSEPDEWSGGAWLTSGDKSAMILLGTKAIGDSWYGFSNGIVFPTSGDPGEVYPEVPPWPHDDRGWWSEDIEAQMIFYDPADLAAVARGEMETWEPQPYAVLCINEYLYDTGFDFERGKTYLVGAAAYDRENNLLYVFERLVDEDDKSLVHVWQVS